MKNIFLSKILKQLLFISVLLTFGFSQGQTKRVLANWMGGNASSISFPYNGDYSNPITNGCSMNYSGITPQNDNRFFFTANPSSTLNTSTSPYISFTINAGSSSIDLDRIVFQSYAGASLNTSLRYSVDGYASNLGSITANGSSYSLTSVDLNSLANISGTVEFRMYFYGNASATSIMLGSTGSAYSSVDGTPSSYGPTPVAPPTGYSWSSVSFWYNYFAPVITTSSSLTTFSKCTGLASNAQTFSVSGTNLTSNITIAALTGYEYSLDGITYTSTLNISPSSGSVASTPVYVRLTTASTGSPSGNISISATGATTQTIAVTGVVNSLPTITIGSVSNVFQSATSFIIPYTATTNSPTLYSVSAGTNALSGFTPVSDVIFSGSSGNLTVPIPINSALGTYDFVLKVKNATTLCESTLVNFTMKVATAPPTITSFSPISGAVGSTVTITGTGFNTTATNNIVSFDGVSATVTSATATSLNVTVPYGTTGFSKIKVLNTATGIAYSKGSFSTTFHNGGFGNGDYNYGTGTFNGAVTFTTAASWQTTADWKSINLLVDYNNDGFPDYTSMSNSSSSIYIYKNAITTPGTTVSTSTFSTTAVTLTATTTPSAIFSEDINGDGKMDLIVPTGSSIDIFINTSSAGTISFATKQTFTLACSNRVRFVDINKDGMLDIFSYSGAAFKYLLNTSTLGAATVNFGTSISLTTATTPLDFDMADFNNDGYLDILFSYASGYYISLGSNTGFGVFTSNASSFSSGNIVSGDLDNDGDIDFVVKTSTSAINYFTNNGSGVFTSLSSSVGSPSGILNGFDLANFNGDAYPEVYSSNANSGPYIAIFNNTTTSNTLSYANSTNAYSSSNPMGLKATDVNGDGRPDIVAPGYYNTSYYVNQNIIGIPTISSFTPTSGSGGTSITITGTYFTGTTDVKFNGISATSFTVNSSTSITAIAPIGTTGTVQVITPGGTATSASNFTYSPTIVRTGTLTAFSKCSGSVSAAQTFTVSGTNLTANLVVAAYTNLEYSLDGTTYSSTLSITPTSGTVATTTIYVRMTAASASLTTGNISITSTGATNQTIAVSGTVSIVTAISAHPSTASQSVCQGATLTALTVTASGTSLTYQWYSNTIASTTGSTLITGATSASYTPTNSVPSTFYYYCVVTGTCGSLTSNFSGLITINETPVAGTATISATTICPGNTVTLSLTGNTGSIQWQSSLNNSTWNNITGATTATYTTAALTTTTYYRAAITSGVCTVANSNVLTVTVPTAPYPFDRAVNFTSGGHLTKAAGTSINLTNWTVEAWIYPTAWNTLAGIVSKRDFQFTTNTNGALSVMIERDWSWELTTTANNVIILNKWQHVAASYNATSKVVKIYVNGSLVQTFTRSQSFVPDFNSYDLKVGYNNGIGNGTPSRTFAGNIDEVKVWNTVRTDAEITANFATQLMGNETGLIAYYKFDQGVGGANNTAITSLIDATANGNHLTPASSSPVYAMTGATNNIVQAGPAILTSPNICLNATTTLTHTVSGGAWSSSDASVLSVNSSTGEATASAEGSATITYTFTDNGCTYSTNKLFTVNPLPLAPLASAIVNLCQGATASPLTATALTGHTLQWYTVQSGGTASTTAPIPSTTVLGQSIYYVSQRNNTTNCEGPRTVITVNVNEVPTISGVQNITVGGSTITLSGSGIPDSTTPWTSSNPAVATITSSGVVTAVAGGTTTITYLTSSGCSKTATLRVVDCSQPFGNALAFGVGTSSANADFVQVNSRIFPSQTVANFTIETWIKPAASDIMSGTPGTSWLSFLGYTGTKRSPSIYITNNGVLHASWSEGSTLIGTPVSASSPTSLGANKWTHVALVKDGTTMRLFVDGIQIQSITCAANLDVPDNAYWLGKSDQQFSGALDEVRFWSTARTQAQIQATMNTELVGNETGLLTYFDFNEGIAGGTNTSITSVINKANNALNGTLTNFTRTGTTSNFVGNSVSSSDIIGAGTICGNTTAQYTHQIPGGTWSVSNGATATISTSGLLTATTNENITLSYTYALNGCSFTATKTVAINSPAPPVTNTTINLCQGVTTSALAATALSGHTLQWYTVATGGTASSTAPTPSVTTLGTTMYYVSQKNNTTNCESARTAITVTVNATPTISGAQSITVGGTPLQLTGSGIADTLTPWTSSNTAAATISSTGVVTAVGAGSTIITYTTANGCTATAVISVVDCSQPFGNALQFDGVDDSFSTASNLSVLSITGNITLETWIKFDQVHADWVRLIGKGDNTNRNYGLWLATTGKLLFQIYGGTALSLESTTALQPGIWYHISATRNGNTAKIYINGIEDASTSTTVTPQTNTFPLTVGYGNMHTWLKGALDEVRVWNVARSLSQIQQGMYNALVGNETGLVAYYDFNQGIAGGNNTSIVSALDRTTNLLHGTLTNFSKTGIASNFIGNTATNFAITGAAVLCANSTSQYTHQVSGGTWSVSSGANATISTTGLLTATANEDITISYTYMINGCSFTATRAISINTPAAPIATTTINLCQGVTASALTATATTGNTLQWYTVASGGTASTTAPTPSVTTLGTTTFYVSQKNNTTNCESTRTAITVIVNAIPTITGIQNMTVGGATLQLTGSGTPDATTPWASSNTAVATISSTGEVTAVAGGTTIITYTTTSGCNKTAILKVIDCTAPFGNALSFDGVDDYAVLDNVGTNTSLQFANTTNYTLEAWVKRTAATTSNAAIIAKQNGGVAGNYSLGISATGMPYLSREASPWAVNATTSIPLNEWTHIAGVFDGVSLKIYINGTLNNSVSTSGSISASSVTAIKVALGCMYINNVPANFFSGSIDEARIWNVARTAPQIQQSYNITLQGNEAGLVAYYDFNQGVPAGDNTTIMSVVNTVNSTSNGVLTNFTKTGTTSNFVGSTIANLPIAGVNAVCTNSTSQFTHPISGGIWSVSNGAVATISASGLLTTIGSENIIVSYSYTINGCSFITTKAVEIFSPAITAQPSTAAQNVCINGVTVTLSVTATGLNNTYQWYRNTTATTTGGTLITGATNSVYMPSNTLVGTNYYYCVVSNTCSLPMTSNVSGAITISPVSVAGTITGSASICSGATTTLTLAGNVGTIQWQRYDNPVWTDLTGATTNIFITPVLTQNTTYRAVVSSGACSVANTNNFNVVVNPLPVISGATSVGAGESVTLTATTTPASSNTWVSSNPAVATITPNGVVNGLTLGTATITYTNSNGCTDSEVITVTTGITLAPVLTLPATNTTGATTLNFNYTLPETPLAGSVRLTFTPVGGGTPIIWTMTNATSAVFSYVVGTNPTTISNVVSGIALGFTTYNVTLAYQDAFSNPVATVTNTNIQTLAPPSISFATTNYTGVINQTISIQTLNTGGGMVTYSVLPSLPNGLSLNTATGLISGTPTVTLTQTAFTVTATNAAGTDTATFNLFIDADTDGDGIGNTTDLDIDGDGVLNSVEIADGTSVFDPCNYLASSQILANVSTSWSQLDCDGDGISNGSDADPNGDGVIDNGPDTDGDGVNDSNDSDIDGDGVLNSCDSDINGDGIIDNGPDTDNDGIKNSCDLDIDGDGIPNGSDSDPDGDGVIDNGPDTDGDGINDANDPDIDGDGIPNGADTDPNGDGVIDNGPDTDGDGIVDSCDSDINGDGIIDNGPDTDNDGIKNSCDPDIDGDGIPNGADSDPDGDGVIDNGPDTDGDGINDANDPDIDGDGIPNTVDNCPTITNPTITTQPNSQVINICPNTVPPTLSVVAIGQQLSYQWYMNTTSSNVGGTPISGATNASYVPNNTLVGPRYYYVVVNGICGMDKSNISGAITVQDITPPTVVAQNVSVALNASGNVTITAAQINNGSTDNCNIATMNVVPSTFTCANIGPNTVTLTIIDSSGNSNTASAIVTVTETILPIVVTQNITVNLNPNGQATITAAQINNGSSDNCGIANMSVSPSTFTCANVGPNTVTLTVTDVNGNVKTGTAVVTIVDTVAPTVQTQNISATLNAQGAATITPAQVNNGSFDNCSIASMTVSPNSFTCANIGANTVTLTATDVNGNVSTATAIVTVILDNSVTGNNDLDALPDNCDDDDDNDGILDVNDNCQFIANQNQLDTDSDGIGDICDSDDDNDGINDAFDNCPLNYNPYQDDRDNDGQGDVCDTIEINVSDAISPNGDGVNDTWIIYNIENHPNNIVRVFNRWGKEVFKARKYQNNWGGEFGTNTETLPEGGSYYYQIDLDGDGTIDNEGWLYISRK